MLLWLKSVNNYLFFKFNYVIISLFLMYIVYQCINTYIFIHFLVHERPSNPINSTYIIITQHKLSKFKILSILKIDSKTNF